MGGGSPKSPPKPAPPATETSKDIEMQADIIRKKAAGQIGRQKTVLTEQVNSAGGATVLG